MATKKQKRAAAEARRAQYMAELAAENKAVLDKDREERAKAAKDAKIKASKELLAKHEAEKAAKEGKSVREQKLAAGKAIREAAESVGVNPELVENNSQGS